jgi:hypothetical protein
MRAMRCNAPNLFFTGILLRTSEREMSSRYGGSLYAYDTRGLASRKFQAVVGVAIRSVAPTHRAGDGAVSGGGNKPDNSGGGGRCGSSATVQYCSKHPLRMCCGDSWRAPRRNIEYSAVEVFSLLPDVSFVFVARFTGPTRAKRLL